MLKQNLYATIDSKNFEIDILASQAAKHPTMIIDLIGGLEINKANIRYGCDKVLRMIGQRYPVALYPYFDFFAANLGSDKTILKWGAIDILANLARVDSENKIEAIFDSYFRPIAGPVMITAANIAKGATQIALAKPQLADRIAIQLMKVEKGKYQTEECRQIVIGQAIRSFALFFNQIKRKKPVIEFARRQLRATRPSTKKYAEKLLKKHS